MDNPITREEMYLAAAAGERLNLPEPITRVEYYLKRIAERYGGGTGTGGNAENGEDGFSPIATVTQTDSGAIISITDKTGTTTATIANGRDGKDGVDGQPGKDGADGAPGEKGDKGDKGDPGEPGQKGEQGIQGIPGEKGEKGDTGAPGADGAKGDKGDKGDTGATGAQGEPGKDGVNGKDGTSATHRWNGTVLTVTSASGTSSADLKGAKGDKGDKGDTGGTPVKGTDYFTDVDKAEMVRDVVTEMQSTTLEPTDGDIPKVFLTGNEFSNMTTEKNEVNMEMDYRSKTDGFHAYIAIKFQGDSSLSYAKKNFTVKLFDDEAHATKQKRVFRNWKYAKHKFVLKANYIDHSHARNIMGARLWNEVVAIRADYDTLPEELRNSPMNGAIDGFPVKLYVNGTYQGIYTWNIGKDDWMWGMDEDNANHILMCAESNSNDIYRETPCNFRTTWDGTDGDKWSVEVGTNGSAVKTSINNLITFIKNNDGTSFKTGIDTYLDVQSAIDYYIHHYVICGLDGLGKNMLLGTYNGQKWHCGSYDMDSTFGLYWNGTKFVSATYRCPEDYQEKCGLLWERLEANYWTEIQSRYTELRKSVYSIGNMFTHFERFMDAVGLDLYAEDLTIFTSIPNGNTNNIKQLRDFIRDRLAYCDQQILNGVPGKGVTLSKTELTLKTETATLTATASPSNTTDDIIWLSSDNSVATVSNGVVTPVADGSCTIRAKCGSGWGVCNVTVSTKVEPETKYTNLVPTSIDTDGSIFNGVGYQHSKRLSSSGVLKDADVYNVATGFIKAKGGDTIRISGYTWYDTTSDMNYLCGYKSDFGFLYAANSKGSYQTTSLIESMSLDGNVSVIKLKAVTNLEYIRVSLKNPSAAVNGANLIVTVNEEIV